MPGQETEADEQVRLAAAHGLLQVEHGLRRRAGEAGDPLADEILHALGDVGALEERRSITLAPDQLVELLDLVAELDRETACPVTGAETERSERGRPEQ